MKIYDETALCPKCGNEDVRVSYCERPRPARACWPSIEADDKDGEHFHRKCSRCHYEWLELCLPEPPVLANHGLEADQTIGTDKTFGFWDNEEDSVYDEM